MDVRVENHGSIILVNPLTGPAIDWVADNLPDDVQMFGNAIVVEPRYVGAIIDGMINDGLEVR